jgi:hypothetical protein
MDKDKKEFWENYKKELINPIDVLISNGHYSAASKLILLGIDSLAGFYSGRITSGQVSSSFIQFVEKYMSKFNDTTFPTSGNILKNRKTGHTIAKPTEILYYIFRNDMIHDGFLGIGVEIYKDNDYKILWSGSGFQIFRINIVGFFEYFKKAIGDYENDLNCDEVLKTNFINKYNDIKFFSFGD